MTTSYYKIARREQFRLTRQSFVFFDDRDADATREAYNAAVRIWSKEGGRLSVFRSPLSRGPWSAVTEVGDNDGIMVAA